ncbi:hypothetical protein FC35_GL001238 [Limosilactobacillus coleohominis DSM 14060]|nr:hypothetical protein FC35_GL001238 [Limosilactobacillus coleohominis DSM 14060]
MKDIVFTLQFSDTQANKRANEYLAKGWTLVNVGSVCVGTFDNGQPENEMAYVVGANKQQYAEYQKEQKSLENAENGVKDFLDYDDEF